MEDKTLWDLLIQPAFSLHLPRFALFLMVALLLEIYCDRKKICLTCSIPTVGLQLFTGVIGIIAIYSMATASFSVGDRVPIAGWYYPLAIVGLCIPSIIFLKGVRSQFSERLRRVGTIRCILFALTLYFAISMITTPTKLNRVLAQYELEAQSRQADPPAGTR